MFSFFSQESSEVPGDKGDLQKCMYNPKTIIFLFMMVCPQTPTTDHNYAANYPVSYTFWCFCGIYFGYGAVYSSVSSDFRIESGSTLSVIRLC